MQQTRFSSSSQITIVDQVKNVQCLTFVLSFMQKTILGKKLFIHNYVCNLNYDGTIGNLF